MFEKNSQISIPPTNKRFHFFLILEKCGIEVGDKLLEVNNISVKGAASSTAVKVLTGSNRLKLVVQRTHKVPEWRLSKEKTSW